MEKFKLFISRQTCKHEESGQKTDRGFQCLYAVSAGEAHWSEDGDALLWGRVAKRGCNHSAVTGGGPRIHHGGQSERFCKVWEIFKVRRTSLPVDFQCLTNVVGKARTPNISYPWKSITRAQGGTSVYFTEVKYHKIVNFDNKICIFTANAHRFNPTTKN